MKHYKVTLDYNYCGSKLSIYNNGLSVKTIFSNQNILNFVRATNGINKGKYYWEVKRNSPTVSGSVNVNIGIVSEDGTDKDTTSMFTSIGYSNGIRTELITGSGTCYLSFDEISQGQIVATSDINSNLMVTQSASIFSTINDTIGLALDMDNKSLSYYINGVSVYTITGLPDKVFYPGLGFFNNANNASISADINFGEDYDFKYPIPDGYKAYFRSAKLLAYISELGNNLYYKDNGTNNKLLHPYWNDTAGAMVGNFGRSNIGVSKGKWYFEAYRSTGYRVTAGILSADATDKNTSGRFLSREAVDTEQYKKFYLASGTGIGFYCCAEANISTIYATRTSDLIDTKHNRTDTYDISSYMLSPKNDTYGFAIDVDNRQLSFYINGKFIAFYKTLPENIYHAAIGIAQGTIATGSATYTGDAGVIFNFGEETPFVYKIPGWYEPYYKAHWIRYIDCKFDASHGGSKLKIYNNGHSVKCSEPAINSIICTKPLSSGKWYWEVTRRYHTISSSSDGSNHLQIGILSADAVVDYSNSSGFSYISSGTGIHYTTFDDYHLPTTTNCVEILATEDIQPGKVIVNNNTNVSLYHSLYTSINQPVGVLLNLDNDTITFYCGSVDNKYTVSIPHKTYYPAIGYHITSQNSINNYGEPDASLNTGYDSVFAYNIPDGVKPYYMASTSNNYKIPRCKLDRSHCCTDIELYADGLSSRLSRLGGGGVRCNTGVKSGKWYWEVKRNNYNIRMPDCTGYSNIGVVSDDADINWDVVQGFTTVWQNPAVTLTTGFGLCYSSAAKFVTTNAPMTEVLGTSTVGQNGILFNYNILPQFMDLMKSDQYDTIGFLLDLDNYIITIMRGNDSSKQVSVAAIPGKTYYPAIANALGSQSFLDTYGPVEVHMNFGELSPFEFNIPDGAKPYYMATVFKEDDLKLY